jgi:hypothetical protein
VSPPVFRVKHKPFFPLFGLAASLFILAVAVFVENGLQGLLGGFLLLISILQLTQPVVVITPGEIQLRNLFGMTLRRIPYTPADVSFQGLHILIEGKRLRGVTPWVLEAGPLRAFKAYIEGASVVHPDSRTP